MKPLVRTNLYFAPDDRYLVATIRRLARRTTRNRVDRDWWADADVLVDPARPPIDLHWDWANTDIDRDGVVLRSDRIGIVTSNRAVQAVMVISTEPDPGSVADESSALFIELLCTAPRNRPPLRRDGRRWFVGAGTELLTYAAHVSVVGGCGGRLRLEGSPESLPFYRKVGFEKTDAPPVAFEGNVYTPMALPAAAAAKLLHDWQGKVLDVEKNS